MDMACVSVRVSCCFTKTALFTRPFNVTSFLIIFAKELHYVGIIIINNNKDIAIVHQFDKLLWCIFCGRVILQE